MKGRCEKSPRYGAEDLVEEWMIEEMRAQEAETSLEAASANSAEPKNGLDPRDNTRSGRDVGQRHTSGEGHAGAT